MPAEPGFGVPLEPFNGSMRSRQLTALPGRLHRHDAVAGRDHPPSIDVPVCGSGVRSGAAANQIGHDDEIAGHDEDMTAMFERGVPVMRSLEIVEDRKSVV